MSRSRTSTAPSASIPAMPRRAPSLRPALSRVAASIAATIPGTVSGAIAALATIAALLAVSGAPTQAWADGLDRHGLGPLQLGGGGLGLDDSDPFGVGLDVALPADTTRTGQGGRRDADGVAMTFAAAWVGGTGGGGITLWQRPTGVDVPASVLTASPAGGWPDPGNKPAPTASLRADRSADGAPSPDSRLALAATARLHRLLGFGLVVALPRNGLLTATGAPTDERAALFDNRVRWARQGGADQVPTVLLALASRPLPWLAVGVGVAVDQVAQAEVETFVSELGGSSTSSAAPMLQRTTVVTRLSPRLALRLGGGQRPWQVLLAASGARGAEIASESAVFLRGFAGGGQALAQQSRFVAGEVAPRLDGQLRWQLGAHRVGLGVVTRSAESLRGAELRLGGQFALPSPSLALVCGAGIAASELPAQVGRANLVDNDRVAGSFGLRWQRRSDIGLWTVSLGARLDWLLPRDHRKDLGSDDPVRDEVPGLIDPKTGKALADADGLQTNNPGYPGYRSEGWLLTTALGVGLGW